SGVAPTLAMQPRRPHRPAIPAPKGCRLLCPVRIQRLSEGAAAQLFDLPAHPVLHLFAGQQSLLIGDIVETLEHIGIGPKAGDAIGNHDGAAVVLSGLFDKSANPYFGIGSLVGPILPQRLGLDTPERPLAPNRVGTRIYQRQPALVFLVRFRTMRTNQTSLARGVRARPAHALGQHRAHLWRLRQALLADRETGLRLDPPESHVVSHALRGRPAMTGVGAMSAMSAVSAMVR